MNVLQVTQLIHEHYMLHVQGQIAAGGSITHEGHTYTVYRVIVGTLTSSTVAAVRNV